MGKIMLVNVVEGEERRIAILDDGTLDDLFQERSDAAQIVGNIYKARVVSIERSLQAAFVDFGGERHGFLHLNDIAPEYYSDRRLAHLRDKSNVDIGAVIQKGSELLVQVAKEGIRNKAPAVTTYLSLPGRYLVLMPQIKRHGVSRKIVDDEEREALRKVLESLKPPENVGIIIRTAAADRGKRELHRDLSYLLRLWATIQKRAKEATAPEMLYQESDLVIRVVRDVFSADIEKIIVDSREAYERILAFMQATMPASRKVVELYTDRVPLFTKYRVEEQIEKIHQNRVPLPGGGYVVIEQTEAMVAIDVNSGRFKKEKSAEETAFKINLQAADEIGRQIRLRDLGGLILCDFIDMRDESHRREVERRLWLQLKRDRARTKMLRMSRFGVIEMTRQRIRRNIELTEYQTCPMCKGTGQVRNAASMVLEAMRRIRVTATSGRYNQIVVRLHPDILVLLQNQRREELLELEKAHNCRIVLEPVADASVDKIELKCYKE